MRAGYFFRTHLRRCQAHGIEVEVGEIGIGLLMHHVADALVGGEVIIESPQRRLADAGFLCTAAPVPDVMPRAQMRETSEVIGVHLAGVAGHRLRHAEDIGATGAEEAVPQPHVGHQLGIVPGHAADIVAPDVAGGFVGMHDVAEVPEAVPVALLHLLLIEREGGVELVLHAASWPAIERSGRPQMPKRLRGMQMLRRADQQRRRLRRGAACWTTSSLAGRSALGYSVNSLVRATPWGVLKPGWTSS